MLTGIQRAFDAVMPLELEDIPITEASPEEPRPATWPRPPKWAVLVICICLLAAITAFAIPYFTLSKRVDRQLASGTFRHTFNYYSARQILSLGDPMPDPELVGALKRSGYSVTPTGKGIILHSNTPVEIQFANGNISSIVDLDNRRQLGQTELPAGLVTNMSDEGRVKRVMIRFQDIPPTLVHAVVSAEDKHFFEHSGFDGPRMAKALYVDMKDGRKEQGASTLSMQLARNLWLNRDKSWKRKVAEVLITMHLERKLNKQQIFEDYCNMVYLGNQGTFSIHGFAEAARAYFNKDLNKLNLTEAATLAGLIQRPSYFNPFAYPDRALDRRNRVLALMRNNKYITPQQFEEAVHAPLNLSRGTSHLAESQYFIDIAGNQASQDLEEQRPAGVANVYTTLDPRLQRAAEQAIADGMQLVDKALARKHAHTQMPQVALIALDPHTGEVKALCGGRDYATSQLNRILAKRPPGSVFKPFVYTAALNTAIVGGNQTLTPASTVADAPTSFAYDDNRRTYTPANFKNQFRGTVTLRQALAHSLNNATVKVGEMVGFENVVALARQAGMNEDIRPTPAVALGAYQVTPLEIAGAYTIFANDGVRVQPTFVSAINDHGGAELYRHNAETKRVLDPRVAFLMEDMLQEVMRSGTAAGARARGFTLPAAGKTGTSHDGWFAGFTSRLLCIVWVGFDDYSELGLEGARSALPIWTEFMMKAARYKQYGDVQPFRPPSGVVRVSIDPQTGLLAGSNCPGVASYFIDGTQPVSQCAPRDPDEIEVSFTEDGGATQRVVSDQSPARLPQLPTRVPSTPTEQPRVVQPPLLQPSNQQPPVQPAAPPQPPPVAPPGQRVPPLPQVRWP
jgi:penicillin-binding protein 1B